MKAERPPITTTRRAAIRVALDATLNPRATPARGPKKRQRNFEKAGTVKVPWYRGADGRTFVDPRKFGRKLVAMRDHDAAVREARRIAIEINAGGVEVLALTAEDRAVFAQATADAMRRGRDLLGAFTDWRDAVDLIGSGLGARDLLAVVRAGVAALRQPVHLTGDTVEALLASKQSSDLDGRYRRQLERHLRDFAAAFPGELRAIEVAQIESWITARKRRDGEPLSAARRNHVRDDVVHLFKFARSRGLLPDAITAAQRVPKFGARTERRRRVVEVLGAAEMRLLLAHVEDAWLPWVAIAAFSGLRPEEIARSYHAAARKDTLRWEDFDWDEREIVVREEVDKNGFARRCPLHDNLRAWLAPWRDAKASGHVVTGSLQKFRQRLKARLVKTFAGADESEQRSARRLIEWPHDVLRHSYGTYRMAATGRNIHQVAAEMGNSPAMIRQHYDKVGPKSHGKAWFAIVPADNVIEVQLGLFREEAATRASA
ncbi:MAG: site-specific integrase [Chthoniobacteraceae bacterium]